MLTYACSVCKGSYPSGDESAWLLHLLQEGHQKLARKELPRWEESVVRNQVLVIFNGAAPVGWDVTMIEGLSQGGWTLVTDFVWCEGRPEVGFVQFGSRDKLLKAMGSIQDHKFVIDACQAGEMIKWWELLADCGALLDLESPSGSGSEPNIWNPVPVRPADTPRMGPSAPKQMKLMGSQQGVPINEPRMIPPPPRVAPSSAVNDDDGALASTEWSSNSNHSDPGTPTSSKGLWDHLSAIRKLIEIPDEEYRTAVDIVYRLQEALNLSLGDGDPFLKPTLSRHWILQLKYGEGDELDNVACAIVIHKEPASKSFKMNQVKGRTMTLLGKERRKHFPQYNIVQNLTKDPNVGMTAGEDFLTLRYGFQPLQDTSAPQLMLNIVLRAKYPVETQVWQLVKHLVSFNPHCLSVLAMAYYWAKINNIRVGGGHSIGNSDAMGDPSAMNWLLIYFFQADGLIPTTGEVMERPHEPVIHNGNDIGFSLDTAWWNPTGGNPLEDREDGGGYEKFAEEVFTLLYRFFLFCECEFGGGSNAEGGWILNTRDSERLSIGEVKAGRGESVTRSKLAHDEFILVRNRLKNKSERFFILHPFLINWRISASNAGKAFKAMKKTGTKLKEFLQSGGGPVKREKLEFGEFLKLLKL